MDPAVLAALISTSVRVLDFLSNSGVTLSEQELRDRETLRRAMVQQALAEGSGGSGGTPPTPSA